MNTQSHLASDAGKAAAMYATEYHKAREQLRALRASHSALVKALEPFAQFGDAPTWKGTMWEGKDGSAQVMFSSATGRAVTLDDFYRAVSAIATAKELT